MNETREERTRRAIECAKSRRSCAGCDAQHLCESTRAAVNKRLTQEHIAALPEWKRRYYYNRT